MIPRICGVCRRGVFILFVVGFAQISYCSSSSQSHLKDELLTEDESRRVPLPSPYSRNHQLQQRPYYDPSSSDGSRLASPYPYESDNGDREQNLGFMDRGPPKGFPSFEEIQAHFQETSASHSAPGQRRPNPEYVHHHDGGRPPPSSSYSSFGHSPHFTQSGVDGPGQYNYGGRGGNIVNSYSEEPHHQNYEYDFNRPQRQRFEQPRPGTQQYAIDHNSNPEEQPLFETQDYPSLNHNLRARSRRSLHNKDKYDNDMMADGSENENFWQPAPYILFDRYKKAGEESVEHHLITPKSNNISFHDSNSEEQRFFPSFPSPYLGGGGINPFGVGGGLGGLNSLAPARAPLFPGPATNQLNRAPSRYHPSTPFKFASAPVPNRGPSSAASHGHDRYREHDNNLLGSGNFEVVRGGTYYGEDDEGPSYHHHGASPFRDDEDAYYAQNNGHSSPYRGGGGDFFANFRDFADINPHSRSYSHHSETRVKKPNNIFNKLVGSDYGDGERLETASSGDNHRPQFSLEYDPMLAND